MVKRSGLQNSKFSLKVRHYQHKSHIRIEVAPEIVNTKSLPLTSGVLTRHLPSIYTSKCFNKNNYTFKKESEATQLGHLFEHILLEYISKIRKSVYNGITRWDWNKDSKGTFYIEIDAGQKDQPAFAIALEKTNYLMSSIIRSK